MSADDRDTRTWIRLDQNFPDHRKVLPLSDAAFRLHVTALCWAARNQTDGRLPAGVMRRLGAASRIKELVAAGLLEKTIDHYEIHDYLKHQQSSADVEAARKTRREDGRFGAHKRHHVNKKAPDAKCEFCVRDGMIPQEAPDDL